MKKMLLGISLFFIQTTMINAVADTGEGISKQRQSEVIYFLKHDCGSCHGINLKGGLGPPLRPENLAEKSNQSLITTILEGRENTAMPPWKPMLSIEETTWLVKQLKQGIAK